MNDGDCMRRKKDARAPRRKKGHTYLHGVMKQCVDSWQKAPHRQTLKRQEFWTLSCLSM